MDTTEDSQAPYIRFVWKHSFKNVKLFNTIFKINIMEVE